MSNPSEKEINIYSLPPSPGKLRQEFCLHRSQRLSCAGRRAQADGCWAGCWWDTGMSCRDGHTLNISCSLHPWDLSSDLFPFIDDSQERRESWASKVARPCGFGPIMMFLKLLCSIKTKIPAQLLSDSEKLPGTSTFSFMRWDLALNVFKYEKGDFSLVIIYKTEGVFHCAVIKVKYI